MIKICACVLEEYGVCIIMHFEECVCIFIHVCDLLCSQFAWVWGSEANEASCNKSKTKARAPVQDKDQDMSSRGLVWDLSFRNKKNVYYCASSAGEP